MPRTIRLILAPVLLLATAATARAQLAHERQPSPGTGGFIATATFLAPAAYMAFASGHGGPFTGAGPIAIAATIFAPMAGYAYGGIAEEALPPLGRRALVAGVTLGAVGILCTSGCGLFGNSDGNAGVAVLVGVAGAITFTAMTVSDIANVPDAIRAHNAKTVAVLPTWVPAQRAPGVGVSLRL